MCIEFINKMISYFDNLISTIFFLTKLFISLYSRDIALPTKVHIVKAMVFPVVMYGCESWIVKKAEH